MRSDESALSRHRDPVWWLRDIVVATVVGVVVAVVSIVGQTWVDDNRAAREQARADQQARHGEQLSNLQFVRGLSAPDPAMPRPFAEFDLQEQNLAGLQLMGADFAYANLADTDISGADLSGADFSSADLRRSDLNRSNLAGAYFGSDRMDAGSGSDRGADLTGANLRNANLSGADLSAADLTGSELQGADLTGVHYDDATRWPEGYLPPGSR